MDVPCYLIYNMEEQGVQRLKCQCITGSMNYKLESDPLAAPVNVRTNRYTCVGRNLKGIPRDMNVWNVNDYYAGIIMELKSFSLPNTMMMDCIKSWEQIDQILLDDEDLGKQLTHHSHFPSLRKLTTYIIAVNTGSSNVYIDASMGGMVNLLPASLIVERARMVQSGKKSHWVNLRNVQKSSR